MKAVQIEQFVVGPGGLGMVTSTNGGASAEITYLAEFEPGMTPFTAPKHQVSMADLRPPTSDDIVAAGEQALARRQDPAPVAGPSLIPA